MFNMSMWMDGRMSILKYVEIYIRILSLKVGQHNGTHCQCFMETYTGDLVIAYTNKAYQEKDE
jgi:hypothetical protein